MFMVNCGKWFVITSLQDVNTLQQHQISFCTANIFMLTCIALETISNQNNYFKFIKNNDLISHILYIVKEMPYHSLLCIVI